MNKIAKTILISAIMILGAIVPATFTLANGLLNIVFEQQPLFQEVNFLPSESVTRWIEVENKSSETQSIGVEVINYSSCRSNCFSDQLNLTIGDGSINFYTSSLTNFFKAGEIKLSDLAVSEKIKYFFTVTFLSESGNEYQEKEVSFDFNIGALGKESIGGETTPGGGGGGGGGGFFIPGLEIYNETASSIELHEVTITWETNTPATSRVIYSSESEPRTLELDNPPNYGYAHTTPEYDTSSKVSLHTIPIYGLNSGTTYYFRCVSRGSLAISQELSFTTPGAKEEIVVVTPQPPIFEPLTPGEETQKPKEETISPEIMPEKETVTVEEQKIGFEGEPKNYFEKLLAAIGNFFNLENPCWIFFLGIVILIILFLLSEKKREGKRKWILPLLILIAIILYCVFCRPTCWILIITAVILLILSLIFKSKKKEKTP
jgi:hypothetical protein